jgi:hypothetical protein
MHTTIMELMMDVENGISQNKQAKLRSLMTNWALCTFLANVLHKMGPGGRAKLTSHGIMITEYLRQTFAIVATIKSRYIRCSEI